MTHSIARGTVLIGILALAGCGDSNASAGKAADGPSSAPARGSGATMAVLRATVTVTGGVVASGTFDAPVPIATCAYVAAHGTMRPPTDGSAPLFYVPEPPEARGEAGSIGGGHTFSTDVSATYKGPGTYTGRQLNATQMRVDAPPGSQETRIFAHPDDIGVMVVNADASGSFRFNGWQDPGSLLISGQVTWTCAEQAAGR